jgi:hypothetical protein
VKDVRTQDFRIQIKNMFFLPFSLFPYFSVLSLRSFFVSLCFFLSSLHFCTSSLSEIITLRFPYVGVIYLLHPDVKMENKLFNYNSKFSFWKKIIRQSTAM